ncbi:MAG TPA: hypothetical protein VGR53_09385 [Nitrososphaerales archaeon]|nr:hypothetical protein [Nitrososphaerales archaeon]
MDIELLLNLFDAAIIIGIAVPTLYMATKVKQSKLRMLTTLLASFLIVHGFYHGAAALGSVPGLDLVGISSDLLIEPIGWLLFFAFAVYFLRKSV